MTKDRFAAQKRRKLFEFIRLKPTTEHIERIVRKIPNENRKLNTQIKWA